MKRFLLCLFLAACHASDDSTGSSTERGPIDVGNNNEDDAAVGRDGGMPPNNNNMPDGARPPVNNMPDASRPPENKPDGAIAPTPDLNPDYRKQGTIAVANKAENFAGTTCSFAYESFTPAMTKTETRVVLAPGFAIFGAGGSRASMRTLATHIASWGVTTYTVDLCTNGNGIDHPKNGAAMAELGSKVGGASVIYAGFSAGGLGAMIAASHSNTTAYLALDAVDKDSRAKDALDAIKKPVYALVGEPSQCNSNGNMLAFYKGRTVPVLKINKAQHFNFEGVPCTGGPKCIFCAGGPKSEAESSTIRALATAAIMGLSGADANALTWWEEDSTAFKVLAAGDAVTRVQ